MTIQTIWSASFAGGLTQVAVTFDDSTLIAQAINYQNLQTVAYVGKVFHNGAQVRSHVLPANTAAGSINLVPDAFHMQATVMPSDANHQSGPWTDYDLPAGWSLSLGPNT